MSQDLNLNQNLFSRITLSLTLALGILHARSDAIASCSYLFSLSSEIMRNAETYNLHTVSLLRGNEYEITSVRPHRNTAIVSLGSGPDVLGLL